MVLLLLYACCYLCDIGIGKPGFIEKIGVGAKQVLRDLSHGK